MSSHNASVSESHVLRQDWSLLRVKHWRLKTIRPLRKANANNSLVILNDESILLIPIYLNTLIVYKTRKGCVAGQSCFIIIRI